MELSINGAKITIEGGSFEVTIQPDGVAVLRINPSKEEKKPEPTDFMEELRKILDGMPSPPPKPSLGPLSYPYPVYPDTTPWYQPYTIPAPSYPRRTEIWCHTNDLNGGFGNRNF